MIPDKLKINNAILNKIGEIRSDLSLSAYDFSEKLGKSKFWLNNVESGKVKYISKEDMQTILEYTNSSDTIEELLEKLLIDDDNKDEERNNLDKRDLLLISPTTEEDEKDYSEKFSKIKNEIIEGFDILFNGIDDKEKALKIFESINYNMHRNLGFMFSIYGLPWCRFSSCDNKEEIINQLYNFIKEKGHTCKECKYNKNNKKIEE